MSWCSRNRRCHRRLYTDRGRLFLVVVAAGGIVVRAAAFFAREFAGFQEAGIFDAVLGPGDGFEADAGDGLAGALADAEGAFINSDKGILNFAEDLPFRLDETQSKFLLEVVGADVGHVDGNVREVGAAFEGFGFHGADIADDFATFFEEEVAEILEVGLGEIGGGSSWRGGRGG